MRGIVLAGGTGSRLWPITFGVSKQLLPIYDKPLIHYPISTLMLAGIRDILIITTPDDERAFFNVLGDGSRYGVRFEYRVQANPNGIAEAFIIGSTFVGDDSVALILGDNIFHGSGLGNQLRKFNDSTGANVFAYKVMDPERYGVVEIDEFSKPIDIVEKPPSPKSNLAVTGLYFYDNSVLQIAKSILPSDRGELEITSVNREFLHRGSLKVNVLERGSVWLDTGTFDSLYAANSYVKVIEDRQGIKIACLEEIAWRNGWLSDENVLENALGYKGSAFGKYLISLVQEVN